MSVAISAFSCLIPSADIRTSFLPYRGEQRPKGAASPCIFYDSVLAWVAMCKAMRPVRPLISLRELVPGAFRLSFGHLQRLLDALDSAIHIVEAVVHRAMLSSSEVMRTFTSETSAWIA